MTNLGGEERTITDSHEALKAHAVPGTSGKGSSSNSGKKLRFSKLWVCKRNSNVSNSKNKRSSLKKNPNNVLARLENIEKTRIPSTEQKSSQTYFDCNSTIDASTETSEKVTVDVEISCCCETVTTASGPDTFIEIRCVNPTRSLGAQTDAGAESIGLARSELKRDKQRSRTISAVRTDEFFEASENIEDDLIYDGMKRCFPYPIELTGKPNYIATCESCESSTDKLVSISHGGLDAAVGSSIIIDVRRDRETLDEDYQKSVSCEVCNGCKELERRIRPKDREFEEEITRFIREECSSCLNRRKNRERKKRSTSFREESTRSPDVHDEDFTHRRSVVEPDNFVKSHHRRDSNEKSSKKQEKSSSTERKSGTSRIIDKQQNSQLEDSSMFLNDSTSSWPYNRELYDSTPAPLHESSRLSLGSIENSTKTSRSPRYREIDRTAETKLFDTLSRSRKPCNLSGREMNFRNEDLDEDVRRRKPRTSQALKTREREDAAIERYQILDKNEPLLRYKRGEPFTFALQKFSKPAPGINEFRHLLSGTCKISEFNNFGKHYEWDQPVNTITRHKFCKCGNGCSGLNSRNKCCCRE